MCSGEEPELSIIFLLLLIEFQSLEFLVQIIDQTGKDLLRLLDVCLFDLCRNGRKNYEIEWNGLSKQRHRVGMG